MKQTFFASAAIVASLAIFSTSIAAPVTVIGEWSDITDKGTVTFNESATTGTGFSAVLTRQKADEAKDVWPTAAVTAAVTETNLAGVKKVVVTYKVNKTTEADGVALFLTPVGEDGVELDQGNYGAFRAVLEGAVGTEVTDTLELSDFNLDWGYDDAKAMKVAGFSVVGTGDDAVCSLAKNTQALATLSGVAFAIEHDNTEGPDNLDVTVKSIEFIK